MKPPYVLSFVGENANGILHWWTEQILDGFGRHGYEHVLLDFTNPAWREELADCMIDAAPEFVFSFQGFGMDLRLEGENFWAQRRIPFLSYMGDSPYHAPGLHAAEGPGLYLLYGCADFLHTYQHYLNGRAYAGILPYGYPANPAARQTPWSRREHGIVYVKTAVDPAAMCSRWSDMPRVVETLLRDSAELVLAGADDTVADVVAEAFAEKHVHWGDRRELFLFVCSQVDRYARAVRAMRMARALLRHDALIIGEWSHLDDGTAQARIRSGVPAGTLDALYAESRVVANTSPSVRHGIHERVMAGLLAGSAVVSDTTPYMTQALRDCPAFRGLDIDGPGFEAELNHALTVELAGAGMPERVAASVRWAEATFSFDEFIERLLDHVGLERHRRTLEDWTFPPQHQPMPKAA